jgi:hypothetical protein
MNAIIIRMYDLGTPLARLADQIQPLLLLGLRLFIAWVFIKAGLTKIEDWDTTLFLFREEYAVPLLSPQVAAFMGTAGELLPAAVAGDRSGRAPRRRRLVRRQCDGRGVLSGPVGIRMSGSLRFTRLVGCRSARADRFRARCAVG